jgi:hypothetical protein
MPVLAKGTILFYVVVVSSVLASLAASFSDGH